MILTRLAYQGRNSNIEIDLQNKKVLKKLNQEYPSEAEIQRFRNEYEVLQNLDVDGVRKAFKYEKVAQTHQLVLEYIEGKHLNEFFEEKTLTLLRKLSIFIQLTQIVSQVHRAGVIHKDLNPKNILITKDQKIYLIDFGISSKFTLKQPNLGNPENLEGTLSYISPEQTGRMNRSVDYRTDLYALGVIFYELLTEKLPFETTEPMDLVYAHLAKIPSSPSNIISQIPEMVSKIVMKLLAKNPEDRYQSALGLARDFEKCQTYLMKQNTIPTFELGAQSFSGKLQIPEKLYGREEERKIILSAFERMLGGRVELTIVAGYSGTGKSALVHETHHLLASTKGYFIEGKFDQFQRNIPFSAWIQAFRNFVDLLLTENEKTLNYWKNAIQKALGKNGVILTEVIPSLEAIIGKQPTVTSLSGQEAQNRFNYVIQNFVKTISTREHPLVIFIDDLQWADLASLNLLQTLVTDRANQYLLCVGAYRNNEVSPTHPLISTLQNIESETYNLNRIEIGNLNQEAVLMMLSETLNFEPNQTLKKLTQTILKKTQGNAFFTHQFLKNLYEEEFLRFSYQEKIWKWNNEKIDEADFTDNVVEFMAHKVEDLPKKTQYLLELSACIGNKFDLKTLGIIAENADKNSLKSDLESAILEGLIFPRKNSYKFAHDRIQQAAYSLIPNIKKEATHLKIGRLLYESLAPEEKEERTFDIVNHYNLAKAIFTEKDHQRAIKLNHRAAQKAKASASFGAMLNYIKTAKELLSRDVWETDYGNTFEIYKILIEAEILNTNFEEAEKSVSEVLEKAQNDIDKAEVLYLLVLQKSAQVLYLEALELGKKALKLLGVALPEKEILKTIFVPKTKEIFDKVKEIGIQELPNLPQTQDRVTNLKGLVYTALDPVTFLTNEIELHIYISVIAIEEVLAEGNTKSIAKAYCNLGQFVGFLFGEYITGYNLGLAGLKLSQNQKNGVLETKAHLILSYFLNHWVNPIDTNINYVMKGVDVGLQSGELEHVMHSINSYVAILLASGQSLKKVSEEMDKYQLLVEKYKSEIAIDTLLTAQLATSFLRAESSEKIERLGTSMPTQEFMQMYLYAFEDIKTGSIACTYLFLFQAYFILEKEEKTEAIYQRLAPRGSSMVNMVTLFQYNFYETLYCIRKYRNNPNEELLETVSANIEQMKTWAKSCPANFFHKYKLLEAEQGTVSGKNFLEIIDLYEESIQSASQNDFIQDAALANELCAYYLLAMGKEKYANPHLLDAYQLYKQWGATAKVDFFEQKYSKLFRNTPEGTITATRNTTFAHTATALGTQSFDVQTILKATTSLSQQIRLQSLVDEMLHLLILNSGATKITLLRQQNKVWYIEADQEDSQTRNTKGEPLANYPHLPRKLVRFVLRSKTPMLLQDASQDERFAKDTYIQAHQSKAILVVPVIHKSKLLALIYLENRLNSGVFHTRRYDLINALATQLAISMENTLLYENLEHKVLERTQELQATNKELEQKQHLLTLSNEELQEYKYRISQSIRSAKLIQQSILPTAEVFKNCFADYFVFYLPKDVVSGDFYWLQPLSPTKTILIEADGTGHGVPGAFMTLIGHAIMNQVILLEQNERPASILEGIDQHLRKILQQEITRNRSGMDLSILVLEKKAEMWNVLFGASGQKLYFFRPNSRLEIIKGSRRKVGGFSNRRRVFEENELELPKGTTLYLSSDGFVDQNDVYRKNFGSKRFQQLLQKFQGETLTAQKQKLTHILKKHQENTDQRDDITIVGIQL